MVLYDVILVGFTGPPKIGDTPADAIAQVFGIDPTTAAEMAECVPTVVRSGVTEDVARKYYNAFHYIGARCEFRLAESTPSPGADAPQGPPLAADSAIEPVASVTRSVTQSATGKLSKVESDDPTAADLVSGELPPDTGISWAEIDPVEAWHGADIPARASSTSSGSRSRMAGAGSNRRVSTGGSNPRVGGSGSGPGSGSGRSRPSVSEVKAAWKAGRDIPLESASVSSDPRSQEEWDRWIDSGLPETDFPSGVAIVDGGDASQRLEEDTSDGTLLDPPHQSGLLAQLDAEALRRQSDADPADGGEPAGTGDEPAAEARSETVSKED